MQLSNYLKLIFLSAIWGSSFIFMSVAVKSFHFAVANELRLILSTVFVGIMGLCFGHISMKREHALYLIVISTVGITIPSFLIYYASSHLPIAIVIICSSLAPMLGLILNAVITKAMIPRGALLGVVFGCTGVGLMIVSEQPVGGTPLAIPGLLAALASSFLYALNNYYVAEKKTGISSFETTFGTFFISALTALPVLIFNPIEAVEPLSGSIALSVLGVIGLLSVVGFQIIKDFGPVKSLLVYHLMPIFALLWSYIFLNEIIHEQAILGGFLILVGLSVVAHNEANVKKNKGIVN